ncbi:hypothetical protein JTB14_016515 [Gonioctena quinquepunctata]|nr:hypothetical protein JTB14_016515 [Gonioctena quinquepunctata]
MERFKLNNVKLEQGDTISSFIVKLKKMSESCNFGSFLKDALRDRLVSGLIQAKLLSESKLTFEKACKIACSLEVAEKHSKDMKPSLNVGKMSMFVVGLKLGRNNSTAGNVFVVKDFMIRKCVWQEIGNVSITGKLDIHRRCVRKLLGFVWFKAQKTTKQKSENPKRMYMK